MLKTTIPTMEIKTSGTDLSAIETLCVTITKGEIRMEKGNDDIEVDNDVISVSLTMEEANVLRENDGAKISIAAIDYNGANHIVKTLWAKIGSRTDYDAWSGGATPPSMAETDLNPIPILFSVSGKIGYEYGGMEPARIAALPINDVEALQKVTYKSAIAARKSNASAGAMNIYFLLSGVKKGSATQTNVTLNSLSVTQTAYQTKEVAETELNLSEWESVDSLRAYTSWSGTSGVYYVEIQEAYVEIKLHWKQEG